MINLTFDIIKENLSSTVKGYVDRLKDTPQGYNWHPETNVLIHTKIVFIRSLSYEDPDVTLAAFFHDLGKVDTTKPNGRDGYSAHEHEQVSCDLVKYSRDTIRLFGANPEVVYWLVRNHMRVKVLDEMGLKKRKALTDHIWSPKLYMLKDCDDMKTLNVGEVISAGGNPFMYIWNKFKKTQI